MGKHMWRTEDKSRCSSAGRIGLCVPGPAKNNSFQHLIMKRISGFRRFFLLSERKENKTLRNDWLSRKRKNFFLLHPHLYSASLPFSPLFSTVPVTNKAEMRFCLGPPHAPSPLSPHSRNPAHSFLPCLRIITPSIVQNLKRRRLRRAAAAAAAPHPTRSKHADERNTKLTT